MASSWGHRLSTKLNIILFHIVIDIILVIGKKLLLVISIIVFGNQTNKAVLPCFPLAAAIRRLGFFLARLLDLYRLLGSRISIPFFDSGTDIRSAEFHTGLTFPDALGCSCQQREDLNVFQTVDVTVEDVKRRRILAHTHCDLKGLLKFLLQSVQVSTTTDEYNALKNDGDQSS